MRGVVYMSTMPSGLTHEMKMELFGEHVRAARLARGLSQEQIARKCGIARSTFMHIEVDYRASSEVMLRVSDYLKIDLSILNSPAAYADMKENK